MLVDVKDSTPTMDVPVQKRTSADREAEMWLNGQLARGRLGDWFPVKHLLTPALAKLLLNCNPDNRNLKVTRATGFAADMTAGRWPENGESIIVSRDGFLNDGQNRCWAVIKSGIPYYACFVFGVSRESRLSVDQGVKRTTGDFLRMDGHKNSNYLAHAAKLLWLYLNGKNLNSGSLVTPLLQQDVVREFPGLEVSVARTITKNARPLGGHGLMTFCHYVISMSAGDESAVDEFFAALLDGIGLDYGDPVYLARKRLASENERRVENHTRAEVIFRAWNMFRTGQRLKKIQTSGNLPKLER